MKKTRRIISFLTSLMMLISVQFMAIIPAQADVAEKEKQPLDGYILTIPDTEDIEITCPSSNGMHASSIDYNYLGKRRYFGSVRYYDYLCYKNSNTWVCFTGKNLTDAVYHTKNSGKKSLSFTKSQTYSSETASSFSSNVGADAGVADMVKANASFGAGITKTVGRKYQASSTIQAEIPASSKTGYYKMHICHNFYRTKVIQQRTDATHKVTKYISMPFGESYAAVLYSSSAAGGSWSIW